ncbi:MAG: hypothetical protein JO266_17945 [Acidobacteria bacterium]|nr:hypothetical protein [Acidobacteriota bacterium]
MADIYLTRNDLISAGISEQEIDEKTSDGTWPILIPLSAVEKRIHPAFGGAGPDDRPILIHKPLSLTTCIDLRSQGKYKSVTYVLRTLIPQFRFITRRRNEGQASEYLTNILNPLNRSISYRIGSIDRAGYLPRIGDTHGHPDHAVAVFSLHNALTQRDRGMEIPLSSLLGGDLSGNIVVIGGPNATRYTRIAWDLRGSPSSPFKLERSKSAILPLRWWGFSDAEQLRDEPFAAWIIDGIGPVVRPNWPLVDRENPKSANIPASQLGSRIQVGDKVGYELVDNYLLITKVPNFFNPSFESEIGLGRKRWSWLLVVEGLHGIGSKAIELLLTKSSKALEAALLKLGDAQYFQLLFKAFGNINGRRFTTIEFVDADISLSKVNDADYVKMHKDAQKRLCE